MIEEIQQQKYDLIIPAKVERLIREWCLKSPSTEWSGTLFYTYTGSFKDKNIKFTIEDFFVSNIGSATYTEFDVKPEVVTYMIENNLLDCKCGLIHSHQGFSAFFSGTDNSTLNSEGKDRTHFLSLIVNNAGQYVAKVTYQVKSAITGTKITSFPTFEGDDSIEEDTREYSREITDVKNYDLNIIVEDSFRELKDYVSSRFEELKRIEVPTSNTQITSSKSKIDTSLFDDYYKEYSSEYNSWGDYPKEFSYFSPKKNQEENQKKEENKKEKIKQNEETDDLEDSIVSLPAEYTRHAIAQLVYGNILVDSDKTITDAELSDWIINDMDSAFSKRYKEPEDSIDFFRCLLESILIEIADTLQNDIEANLFEYTVCTNIVEYLATLTKGIENQFICLIVEILNDYIDGTF